MLKLIVSNRESQVTWLQTFPDFHEFKPVRYLGDLVDDLRPGDVVAGSLPLDVAARICAKGAEYWNIRTSRNQVTRRDLTDDDRDHFTTVVRYRVEKGERKL